MHPKNRMEKAIALKAIADAAEKLEKTGANPVDVTSFIVGAREKLADERPDLEKYARAIKSAFSWTKENQ